jgi:DDE family transposase
MLPSLLAAQNGEQDSNCRLRCHVTLECDTICVTPSTVMQRLPESNFWPSNAMFYRPCGISERPRAGPAGPIPEKREPNPAQQAADPRAGHASGADPTGPLRRQARQCDLQVAHYPPGCSKYNPIEHRLFCHVTRSLQAVVLKTIEIVRDFIARTTTALGLRVFAEIATQTYEKGRQATHDFLSADPIEYDKFLPELNYTAPWVTLL